MEVIVFRAYRPKTQQPVRLSPLPMLAKGGKTYTGQGEHEVYESLTPEEKAKMAYVITPQTVVQIHDGKTLRVNEDPADAANWKWIQKHPYIAMDKEEGKKSRDAVYYVENKAKDADREITKDRLITKAKGVMYDASREELNLVAKALGHPSPETFSSNEVQKYLVDIIMATPESVIDAFKPENKPQVNVRSLLADFQRTKIIVQSRGSFFYGGEHGTHLGRSEQDVVDFLMDDKNVALVDAMTSQLDELLKPSA